MFFYISDRWVFESPFLYYFVCSSCAESVLLHGHNGLPGQKSPYSLDCMDALTLQNTGWKHIILTSNQLVEWFGALAIGPPGAPELSKVFVSPARWVFL
jgi:hypothetical protein